MSCTICGANNQTEFPAEVNIHLSSELRNTDKSGVFVFPQLLICLDCGSSSFMAPMLELKRLRAADKPLG
jgi:hypothetical protein